MRYSYSQVWILVSTIHWIIPLILIAWTWRKDYTSAVSWIMQAVLLASYITFVFLMGTWMTDLSEPLIEVSKSSLTS